MTTITSREQERRAIIKQYPLTYPLALIGISLLVGIVLGFRLFASPDSGYAVNLYTTLIDVGLTVGVIEVLSRRRDRRWADRERLQELITQMQSDENILTKAAVDLLRLKGWLMDGSLERVDLEAANLEGTHLPFANLKGTILEAAKLSGANMLSANLQGAYLMDAEMIATNLQGANLQGADMECVSLQGADLGSARLEGANLWGADMQNADVWGAHFDEHTTLPDNTNWTPDTDMRRFTDPNHSNFWRPDDFAPSTYSGDVS